VTTYFEHMAAVCDARRTCSASGLYGISFDSAWEAQRYEELLNMERSGLINDLGVHVPFALDVYALDGRSVRVGAYVADFRYWRDGVMVIEDAKGKATRQNPLYLWKKSHFELQYGIRITEVERYKPRTGVGT
jgi:hypothetical protein